METVVVPTAKAGESSRHPPFGVRVVRMALGTLQAAMSVVPLGVALWFGRRAGDLAYWVVYPRTRVALDQITSALGDRLGLRERRNIIRRMYQNFGQGVVEFLRLPRLIESGRLDELVTVEGEAYVREAFARGKGVLILTAHYGNFELLSAFFAARGYRVNLVTRRLKNGVLDRFWAEQRSRLNIRPIFKDDSVKEVVGCLRRNEAIGYVLDQNMGPGQGVFVEFFGQPASTLNVVAVLAKRFGSPVVPVFIIRERDDPTRHRIVFEPPMEGTDDDILHQTQRYTSVIERRIRERPDHWIWIHRRWKTQPPRSHEMRQPALLGREGKG